MKELMVIMLALILRILHTVALRVSVPEGR